jgi:hypothetical protein
MPIPVSAVWSKYFSIIRKSERRGKRENEERKKRKERV